MNVNLYNLTTNHHMKLWTERIQFSYLWSKTWKTILLSLQSVPNPTLIAKFVIASVFHLLFFVPQGLAIHLHKYRAIKIRFSLIFLSNLHHMSLE